VDADPLADAAADLYALPPEEFTAARDEAVKAARASGDKRLAAAIGKLRKPTVGAWVVNQLAHERPDLVDDLLGLAEELRAAQRNLRGDELRELTLRRRQLITQLAREAVRLANRAHGRANLPVAEIQATLTAALSDPDVAAVVRAGQLTKTVEYAGFGETPRPQLRLVQGGESTAPSAPPRPPEIDVGLSSPGSRGNRGLDSPTSMKERAAAEQRRVAEERRAAEEKRAEEERAEEQRKAEQQRKADERAAAAELRRARAAAHRELLQARTELADAEAVRAAAERSVLAARRRVEKATAAVNALADQAER
jgi:hypothetical protein